jgi:hypothetical protein
MPSTPLKLTSWYIALLTSIILQFNCLYAQDRINLDEDTKPQLKDRLFWGGNIGLQFGNVTLIDVSPLIGYKINPRIGVGISPTYKYFAYKSYYIDNSDLKTNVFGASIFARAIVYQNLFAHAEYEYLTYNTKENIQASTRIYSTDFQSMLIGGGYREPISDRAFMYILLLWNLNETIDSPYTNPIIRAGFSVGF